MTSTEKFKEWYSKNREYYNEYQRDYRKRNRKRVSEIERKSVNKRILKEIKERL